MVILQYKHLNISYCLLRTVKQILGVCLRWTILLNSKYFLWKRCCRGNTAASRDGFEATVFFVGSSDIWVSSPKHFLHQLCCCTAEPRTHSISKAGRCFEDFVSLVVTWTEFWTCGSPWTHHHAGFITQLNSGNLQVVFQNLN